MADVIGSLVYELIADSKKLEATVRDMQNRLSKFKSPTINIETTLAKRKVSELQAMKTRLEAVYNKKLKLDTDVASINRTKTALDAVNNTLNKVKQSAKPSGGSSIFSSLGAIIGIGAGFGLLQGFQSLIRSVSTSIDLARQQLVAEAKVSQAVKTTGQAAGFTAEQLKNMAAQLQAITGVGDEKILNDVTLQLLTFTNITKSSFSRAQQAALDLSAVIGSDLLSQTIQLGKALEDPVKGVSALQRVGITFTEVQKDQIKNFINQNNLMGAQSLILTEIETKYGGQAKAIADAVGGVKQFQASIGDFMEKVGNKFLPFIANGIQGLTALANAFGLFDSPAPKTLIESLEDQIGKLTASGGTKEQIDTLRNLLVNELQKDLTVKFPALSAEYANRGGINFENINTANKTASSYVSQYTKELNAAETKLLEYQSALDNLANTTENASGRSMYSDLIKQTKDNIAVIQSRINANKEDIVNSTKAAAALSRIKTLQNEIAGIQSKAAIVPLTEEELKKLEDSTADYYNTVKFEDDNYVSWYKQNLEKTIAAKKVELGSKFNEEVYRSNQIKKLTDDETNYKINKYQELVKKRNEQLALLPAIEETSFNDINLENVSIGGISWEQYKTDKERYLRMEQDAQITRADLWEAANSSISSGLAELFSFMQIKITANENIFISSIKNIVNAFTSAVAQMIAKWLAFQALSAIPGFGPIAALAGAANITNGPSIANDPGSILQNFNPTAQTFNASKFPALSSSNTLNIANTGSDSRLLKSIDNKIGALTLTLIEKDLSVNIQSVYDDLEVVRKKVAPAQNKLTKSGVKLNDIR